MAWRCPAGEAGGCMPRGSAGGTAHSHWGREEREVGWADHSGHGTHGADVGIAEQLQSTFSRLKL